MDNPYKRVLLYWLGAAGIMLGLRLVDHHWPPVGPSVAVIPGGTYYLWAQARKRNSKAA